MKNKLLLITIGICVLLCVFILIKRYKSPAVQKQTRYVMDTYCTIQIPGDKSVIPFIERSFLRIEEIDKKCNVLNPESPLFGCNKSNGVFADKEICNLITIALQISRESEGSFDITVYPLLELWGFYSGDYTIPEKIEINETLSRVGYRYLEVSNDTLYKTKDSVAFDLGGIAKGYALQEAVKELKEAGISSALVDAGGDLYALGTFKERPWKVGIRHPRGEGMIGVLEVSDFAVVTSGDYERFFEKDGTKYHHIIDPHSGYPARELMSVTVICKDAVKADAWSTALFVMTPEKALSTVEAIPYLEAVLVTAKGNVRYSSGLADNLEMTNAGPIDDK